MRGNHSPGEYRGGVAGVGGPGGSVANSGIDVYSVLGLAHDCSAADLDEACLRRADELMREAAVELLANRLALNPNIQERVVQRHAELLGEWLTSREAAELARLHKKTFLRKVREPEARMVTCYDALGRAVHRDEGGVLRLVPHNARWKRIEVNAWIGSTVGDVKLKKAA